MNLSHPIHIISGGTTRQASVLNALKTINKESTILIHDGVRPFITKKMISNCIKGARKTGACIPAIQVTDSLKHFCNKTKTVISIKRENFWLAQTPQTFNFDLIFKAHCQAKKINFHGTDDASIAEANGASINIINGNINNIKITTEHDLILAEAIIKTNLNINKL